MSKKVDIPVDKYLVLHCNGFYAKEIMPSLTGAVISGYAQFNGGHVLPMGCPCITTDDFENAASMEDIDSPEAAAKYHTANKVVIPWPGRQNAGPYLRIDVISKSIRKLTTKIKSPIETMIVKEGTFLDIDRLTRLREFLSEGGSVSFIVPEKDKRPKNVIEFVKGLTEQFRYNFETWNYLPHLDNDIMAMEEKDELISVINFFNVQSITSISDTRKVDGIAFSMQHVLRSVIGRKKYIDATDTMFFILSNYCENITHLDGCQINSFRYVDGGTFDRMARALSRKAMRKAGMSSGSGGGGKKTKSNDKATLKEVVENRKESDTSTWGTTYTSSSTTTYYYR